MELKQLRGLDIAILRFGEISKALRSELRLSPVMEPNDQPNVQRLDDGGTGAPFTSITRVLAYHLADIAEHRRSQYQETC